MHTRLQWTAVLSAILLAIGASGCALADGLRDGITKGSSAAMTEIIKAPILQALSGLFPDA